MGQVMQINLNLLERALTLAAAGEVFDLVHAHDWVTAYAGKALKHGLRLPLLATVHATEFGRNNGLHNDLQRRISDVEWWLCYEAWRVICCSEYMSGELQKVFQLPLDKIRVVPNGVCPDEFRSDPVPSGFRARYAAPDELILFHVGRLVPEKGLGVLVAAMPMILKEHPQTKLLITGRGPYEAELKEQARRLGVDNRVFFTGYIDDKTRNILYRLAEVAIFPSLYEPFGIVALEAMAAGAPVLVSETGGLGEIIVHGRNGLKMHPGNAASLAENVLWMLKHPRQVEQMRRQGLADIVEIYNWALLAGKTSRIYEEILSCDHSAPRFSPWEKTEHHEELNRYDYCEVSRY
jgi:glycogen(starch) synthase